MKRVFQQSHFDRKVLSIATAVLFSFLAIEPAHALISSTGDVAPDPFSFGDTTLSVALSVGNIFEGSVSIGETSTLTTEGGAFIGNSASGTMEVFGIWNDNSFINIGHTSTGELTVRSSGTLNGNRATLGVLADSDGNANVLGFFNSTEKVVVGNYGCGNMIIQNGGAVNHSNTDWFNSSDIGKYTDSEGVVIVTGAGSTWTDSGPMIIGDQGTGNLTIQNGGSVTSTGVYGSPSSGMLGLNAGSEGTATVTGTGSTWTNNGSLGVGIRGKGILTIADGGLVNCHYLSISFDPSVFGTGTGEGMVTVTGEGSTLTATENYFSQIGPTDTDKGSLIIENGGNVQLRALLVGRDAGSEGLLVVQNATLAIDTTLGIGYTTFGEGGGKGTTRLVNGTVTAMYVRIGENGKLIGTGTVTGDVYLADGGKISPGLSPGQMTINGDLNITNGLMELEADSPSLKDELVVSGNVNIGPEAVFNILLGFGITEAFDIGDFFFDVSGNLTVDPEFQADQINIIFTADSGMSNGQSVEIILGGSQFSVPVTVLPPTYVEVSIDIKPGSYPSSVNLKSKGLTPVAIHTTQNFDATEINPLNVILGDCAFPVNAELYDCDEFPNPAYDSVLNHDVPEMIGDGDIDMVLYFITKDLECLGDVTEVTLTGETYEGVNILGTGDISFVKQGKP